MRNLSKDEIECRLQSTTDSTAQFLLYKTPRTDVKLLTEAYGAKWKNEFQSIDGKLYCTISVWNDEIQSWVSRSNVGTESNIEQEKGQASDAIKRAGFMWEIGSELYTAPQIKVNLTSADMYNGKCTLKLSIKDIEISPEHRITKLVLVDRFGNERFNWSLNDQPKEAIIQSTQTEQQLKHSTPNLDERTAKTIEYIKETAKREYDKPGANQKEIKSFAKYWINKIQESGWYSKKDFDFKERYESWLSKVRAS